MSTNHDLSYDFYINHAFADLDEFEFYIEWSEGNDLDYLSEETFRDYGWYLEEMSVQHALVSREW